MGDSSESSEQDADRSTDNNIQAHEVSEGTRNSWNWTRASDIGTSGYFILDLQGEP